MPFDFPTTPTEGQLHTPSGGPTYVYNAPRWNLLAGGVEGTPGPAGPAGPAGADGAPGAPGPPGTTSWTGITDKPATFPPTTPIPYASISGTPTALPPNGAAGGDLAGTYPDPTLAVDRVKKTGDTMTGTLTGTFGTITTNKPFLDATQTWNNAATTFNAIKLNVTATAQNDASALMLLQRGGSDVFKVDRFGTLITGGGIYNGDVVQSWGRHHAMSNTAIPAGGTQNNGINFSSTANFGIVHGSGAPDKVQARGSLYLRSDGAPYYNLDGTGAGWTQLAPLSAIPAALPPNGAATGDLTGTYPAPTIKASVALTGNPTAPTPTAGDNDTSIATTAFVTAAVVAASTSGDFWAYSPSLAVTNAALTVKPPVIVGNTGGWYNAATGVYTPPAGRYAITAWMSLSAAGAVDGRLALNKNGVQVAIGVQTVPAADYYASTTVDVLVDANGTDTFEIQALQTTGSTLAVISFKAYPISGIKGPPGDPGAPASGGTLQTVGTQTGAMLTGTVLIPADDTIPQISEGTECMTLVVTPKSATSTLYIDVNFFGSHSVAGATGVALFQDAVADALACVSAQNIANGLVSIKYTHIVASGSTTARTYRVRAGGSAAGTTTFNGFGGARRFGGVASSSIVIQEVAP